MSDLHTKRAAEMFGVSEDSVTPEMRQVAKTYFFAESYGGLGPVIHMDGVTKTLLEDLKNQFAKAATNIKAGRCADCGKTLEKPGEGEAAGVRVIRVVDSPYVAIQQFTDNLSIQEFQITGCCQDCQDKLYKYLQEIEDEQGPIADEFEEREPF